MPDVLIVDDDDDDLSEMVAMAHFLQEIDVHCIPEGKLLLTQ